MEKQYPDISGIFAAKALQRRVLAQLTWEEKVAIVTRMRDLLPRGMWRERTSVLPEKDDKEVKSWEHR